MKRINHIYDNIAEKFQEYTNEGLDVDCPELGENFVKSIKMPRLVLNEVIEMLNKIKERSS